MKKFLTLIGLAACTVANVMAANYSTEATLTRQKDKGTYEVVVRVSQLVERNGVQVEELINQPKIISAPGCPASLYSGLQQADSDYSRKENVSVEVSWPAVGKRDFAICKVVIKLGDQIVSKTKLQVVIDEE